MATGARPDTKVAPLLLRLAARMTRPGAYLFAAFVTTVALLLRLWLARFLGPPYLLFFPAIVIATIVGGFGPSVLAIALSSAYSALLILPAEHASQPPSLRELTSLAVFAGVSASISYLADRYRKSQGQLQRLEIERVRSAAESRFNQMADAAPVLIWMSGLDMACIWFNHAWLEFTGRTMEQEAGTGWAAGVHQDDLEACLSTYRDAFRRRQPFTMDYRLRRHDGEYRWVLDTGTPRLDEHGDFAGYIGSCVDITDRRRIEDELRTNQLRLDMAVRSGQIGLWDLDLVSGRAWRTPLHDRLFGYASLQPTWGVEEALRHVVPADRPVFDQAFKEAFQTGHFHYVLRIDPASGSQRWIAADGEVIRDEQGTPTRMMGAVVDVTEQRQTEAALAESQSRLELFIRHAPAAIAMLDRELRYLAVSERYITDYRLSLEERPVVGQRHYDLFPDLPERWKCIHRRCLAGAVERSEEEPFVRADGRTEWVRWEIRPWRDAAGEVGGILIFSEVVTERKEMEARASRAERLAAVSTLVRGMSHEVNNPLASIVSNIDFAREQVASAPQPARAAWEGGGHPPITDLEEGLADAAAAANRIRVIVKDMNTFLPHELTTDRNARPGEALDSALALAQGELRTCASVRVAVPDLPEVAVNTEELVQVLFSLLANAGLATGARPNHVLIGGELRADATVTLTITDSGVGMAPSVLQRAFEPFFTTRGVGKGKGLGLSLCRGIVDSVGGDLSLRSELGKGTTASVTLPVSNRASPALPRA